MIIRVVDVETCGFPPDHCQVCEIATIDLVQGEDSKWTRGRVWSTLVNPGIPIPAEASAIHNITDDMVTDAPSIAEVMSGVEDEPACALLAAHEAKFEQACLPQIASRINICTRKAAQVLWPDAPNHQVQTLRYWLRLKFVDPITPHRALGDATVTAAILRACLAQCSIEELVEISAKPVLMTRFLFGKHAMTPIADVPTDYLEWVLKGERMDEDTIYTARCEIAERRAVARSRSPV